MSASTERLLEQIKLVEETLIVAKQDSQTAIVAQCEADLRVLRRSLSQANEALTEGKQILKG